MEEARFSEANDKICDLIEAYERLDAGGAYRLGVSNDGLASKVNDNRVKEGKGGEFNDTKEEEKRRKMSILFDKRRGPIVGL